MEKILEIVKERNMILLSSEVPLSQAKVESLLFEVGKKVFRDKKWIIPLFSESGKKAMIVNVSEDTEFIKGWVLTIPYMLAHGMKPEPVKAKDIKRLVKAGDPIISPKGINRGLPDFVFTFEYAERWLSLIRSLARTERIIREKWSPNYDLYIKDLVDKGFIDYSFNLKVPFSSINAYLGKYFDTKKWFRVCPCCLKPVPIVGKAVRKVFCNHCLKHYKAINKRVLKLKKECFSDRRFKDKFETGRIPKDYELIKTYPDKQRQLIAYYKLIEIANKRVTDIEDHINKLSKWHELCKDLFIFKD